MVINDALLFARHIISLHSLPVFGPDYQPREARAETTFKGLLQTYEIVSNTAERDLHAQSKICNCNANRTVTEPRATESTICGKSTVIEAASR